MISLCGDVAEPVDAADLKSAGRKAVRVRLPPSLPGCFCIVALVTAMRQGELLGLRWDAIQDRMALLRETKNGRARAVPLSTRAWSAIEKLPRSIDGRVFRISAAALDYQRRAIRQCAGSKELRWHDLRHEAVSRLFEKGLSAEEAMQISGHKTYAMLARYSYPRSATLLEKLG